MKALCFAIMPFDESFNDIAEIIENAASECGLEYVRGDRRKTPGSIMPQVLQDIRRAAVVVADITDQNANVFYELGIAHHILGPDKVVLITQSTDRSPYDVREFRQFGYGHDRQGRDELRKELPDCIREALKASIDSEVWSIVRGRVQRTRLIVRDLKRLADKLTSESAPKTVIRINAGLGSLAISNQEPLEASIGQQYHDYLIEERDALRECLVRGATLKAVINPPRRFAQSMLPERLRERFARLIGLLDGRSDILDDSEGVEKNLIAIKQSQFVLSPVPMPNLFVIGNEVAYEGIKRGGRGGFNLTHCETDGEAIRHISKEFDQMFEKNKADMMRTHPPDGQVLEQLKGFYDEAISHS